MGAREAPRLRQSGARGRVWGVGRVCVCVGGGMGREGAGKGKDRGRDSVTMAETRPDGWREAETEKALAKWGEPRWVQGKAREAYRAHT